MNIEHRTSIGVMQPACAQGVPGECHAMRCPGMMAAMKHIYTTMHQHLNAMHLHRMPDARTMHAGCMNNACWMHEQCITDDTWMIHG